MKKFFRFRDKFNMKKFLQDKDDAITATCIFLRSYNIIAIVESAKLLSGKLTIMQVYC